jgi:SAM-dependent methyltransferase
MQKGKPIHVKATTQNFSEQAYLDANPDVAEAVRTRVFRSGRHHFETFGEKEKRKLLFGTGAILDTKQRKLERIRRLLRDDMPCVESAAGFDFLTPELRKEFKIVDTSNVSSNDYDGIVLSLIDRHARGLILDCGAGKRSRYFENVVNYEIVQYDSTDVRGVAEVLPFRDGVFDAVISIAVLEHVKDPFRCAAELMRVLKPGGEIVCCVPFLQPYHGYPHHYYNMTSQGLVNLFADYVDVDSVQVIDSVLPIWSLVWIIQSWADGLSSKTRNAFLDMRVGDFLGSPTQFLNEPFVRELSEEKNKELASACLLQAHRKSN